MSFMTEQNYHQLLAGLIFTPLREDIELTQEDMRNLVIANYGPKATEFFTRWLGSMLKRKILARKGDLIYLVAVKNAKPVENIQIKSDYL